MASWLFGEDLYLGGVSARDGKHVGKFRPARRSTELKIAARNKARNLGVRAKKLAATEAARQKALADERRAAAAPSSRPLISDAAAQARQLATAAAATAAEAKQLAVAVEPVTTIAKQIAAGALPPPPEGAKLVQQVAVAAPAPVVTAPAAIAPTAAALPPPPAGTTVVAVAPTATAIAPTPTTTTTTSFRRFASSLLGAMLYDGLGEEAPAEEPLPDVFAYDEEETTDPAAADVGYVPSGKAWVSVEAIPFYWDPIGTRKRTDPATRQIYYVNQDERGWASEQTPYAPLDPVVFPDGTPLVGHVWFPKVNLSDLNPTIYRGFKRRVGIGWGGLYPRMKANSDAEELVIAPDPEAVPNGYQYFGVNTTGRNGEVSKFPPSGGPEAEMLKFETGWIWAEAMNVQWVEWVMNNSFDWTEATPTKAAYPWLYDNFGAKFLGWLEQPADFWRSDGKSLSEGGSLALPGPPWPFACIEFLDAFVLGAHGLPKVLRTDGTIDMRAVVEKYTAMGAPWDRLVNVFNQGAPVMFATIYDNKPANLIPEAPPMMTEPAPTEPPASGPGDAIPADVTTTEATTVATAPPAEPEIFVDEYGNEIPPSELDYYQDIGVAIPQATAGAPPPPSGATVIATAPPSSSSSSSYPASYPNYPGAPASSARRFYDDGGYDYDADAEAEEEGDGTAEIEEGDDNAAYFEERQEEYFEEGGELEELEEYDDEGDDVEIVEVVEEEPESDENRFLSRMAASGRRRWW